MQILWKFIAVGISTLSANLASEISTRTSADTALGQRIDSLQSDYNGNKSSVASQIRTLTDAKNSQATQISQITANVTTAQNTANTATTKADDGIRRANNAQNTANTATTKADNAQRTANTANSAITAEQRARADADSSLSSRINALDSKFTTADNTIKASIAQAQQTATNAQQAVATAQSQLNAKIDGLAIGGRNYLSDSANLTDGKLWIWGKAGDETLGKATQTAGMLSLRGRVNGKWKQWYQVAKVREQASNAKASDVLAKMEIGKTYTLSFEAKSANATDNLRADFREHYTHNGNKATNHLSKTWQITNQWVRYHASFVFNPININGATLRHWGLFFLYFGTSEVFIRKPKLELGTIATDHTEAPEDVQEQIDTKAGTASLDEFKSAQATKDTATAQRIAALDAAYKLADTTLTARIAREETARANADTALTQRLDSLQSTINGNKSSVDSQIKALSDKEKAQATKLSQLESNLGQKASAAALNNLTSKVSQVEGRITAEVSKHNTLQTTVNNHTASIRNVEQSVNGVKVIKAVTVDNNGFISGYGLMSELQNGRVISRFGINADQIYFGSTTSSKKPFVFATRPTNIDGISYPAGAWFNSASIAAATITNTHIANAAITSAKIGTAQIGTAHIANGAIDTAKIRDGVITTAKIGIAQIDTLQIAGEAVIAPRVQFTESAFEFYNIDTEKIVNSITVDAKGGAVAISFGFESLNARAGGNNSGDNGRVILRIKRGERVLRTLSYTKTDYVFWYSSGWGENTTTHVQAAININHRTLPTLVDVPPAGNQTYTVTLESRGLNSGKSSRDRATHPVTITARSFGVMAVKR